MKLEAARHCENVGQRIFDLFGAICTLSVGEGMEFVSFKLLWERLE